MKRTLNPVNKPLFSIATALCSMERAVDAACCENSILSNMFKTREFQTQLLHYFSKNDNESNHHCLSGATHCVQLQHTTAHRNTLQHIATHCNTLQHTTAWMRCNTLQHTATYCNTLQRNATHCNTLHYTASHCNDDCCFYYLKLWLNTLDWGSM